MPCKVQQSVCSDCVTYVKSGIKFNTFNTFNNVEIEESYTSKCSFLDNEEICKHTSYKGKRVKRGLFKSNDGTLINADVNGSLNILKKVVGNFNYDPIEVCSTPSVYTVKFN